MKHILGSKVILYLLTLVIVITIMVQILFRYISINYSLDRYIFIFIFIYIIYCSARFHIREKTLLLVSLILYVTASLFSIITLNILGETFFRLSFLFMLLGVSYSFIRISKKSIKEGKLN